MHSRGVSQVVVTVLVILLVLVATAMIWVVVNAFLGKSDINQKVDCVALQLQPVSCVYNDTTKLIAVNVHRDSGVSGLSNLNFIFSAGSNKVIAEKSSSLGQLETRRYLLSYADAGISNGVGASLTGVNVAGKSGSAACNPSSEPIQCGEGNVEGGGCNLGDPCTTEDGYSGTKTTCNDDGSYTCTTTEFCGDLICNGLETDTCADCGGQNGWGPINNDCDALYIGGNANRGNLQVVIDGNGENTNFEVKMGDGQVLRRKSPNDLFVSPHSNKLDISYKIVPGATCANSGVDILFTVRNTDQQNMVDMFDYLQVPGIMQTVDPSKQGYYLYDNDYGGMIRMIKKNGQFKNHYLGGLTQGSNEIDRFQWPGVYSPIIVTHDDSFAVGSALMYPYLNYKHAVIMTLNRSNDGSWTHKYSNFVRESDTKTSQIGPGETRSYNISIRFTRPDSYYWLYTLAPYKKFFDDTYDSGRYTQSFDLKPIRGLRLAGWGNGTTGDPGCTDFGVPAKLFGRFYCDKGTAKQKNAGITTQRLLQVDGWNSLIDFLIPDGQSKGYDRFMFGIASGFYNSSHHENDCGVNECNFPAQPLDFNPYLLQSDNAFSKIPKLGMDFGFWWGRANEVSYYSNGQILKATDWNPDINKLVNFSIPAEKDFYYRQLKSMLMRNATVIGVDGFTGLPWEKYSRLDDFRTLARQHPYNREVFIIVEGSQADFIHTKAANYYSPCKHVNLAGPDALAYYLNPDQEIWVDHASILKYTDDNGNLQPICDGTEEKDLSKIRERIKWGYTLIFNTYNPQLDDVWNLNTINSDYRRNECFDNINNDGDKNEFGQDATDFPFDPQCDSFTDNDESQ